MKRLIAIPVLLVLVIVFWAVAKADQHETATIEAVLRSFTAAWNAGDAEAIAKHYHASGSSEFGGGGGLLRQPDTAELQAEWFDGLKRWFDAGAEVRIRRIRHPDIKVYGNTAISARYIRLTVKNPNEGSTTATYRSSLIWIKEDGTWKIVHVHQSPLIIQPAVIIEPPDDDDDADDDDDDD